MEPPSIARFSTSDVPAGERLAYWRANVESAFVPLDVRPIAADADFEGTAALRELGELRVAHLHARSMSAVHTHGHVARTDEDDYFLALQVDGIAHATQAGRSLTLRAGDLALFDSSRPYAFRFLARDRFRHLIFRIPRAALDARDSSLAEAMAVPVEFRSDEGRIVSPYLLALARLPASTAARSSHGLAASAIDMLATALGATRTGSSPGHHAVPALARAKRETLARLGDPRLRPADVAAASFVSVRQLHRLFASEGITFGQYLREQRLSRVRSDLLDPRLARRPIGEIGARHGYSNPSHLTRSFAARYGSTPRELRRSATGLPGADRT
jgi:AraC-like DNA-binding protein